MQEFTVASNMDTGGSVLCSGIDLLFTSSLAKCTQHGVLNCPSEHKAEKWTFEHYHNLWGRNCVCESNHIYPRSLWVCESVTLWTCPSVNLWTCSSMNHRTCSSVNIWTCSYVSLSCPYPVSSQTRSTIIICWHKTEILRRVGEKRNYGDINKVA